MPFFTWGAISGLTKRENLIANAIAFQSEEFLKVMTSSFVRPEQCMIDKIV